jgi:LAO/AO transport system kinase
MNEEQLHKWLNSRQKRKAGFRPELLLENIRSGDRAALASGITLLESTKPADKLLANQLIELCLPYTGQSVRIGITGVPGVGKSTFIEAFGMNLIRAGKKLAVLAIDPSSEKSGGSILGDKTRMNELSAAENAFIRPSPAGGSLGGVARKTRESVLLCEAAGYDVILIETVGVGQSETVVHSMVDFFLLLMLAGAGDELQGIKRGIMEMADALVITKADGENVRKANLARQEYQNALHLFPANKNGWTPQSMTCSALHGQSIEKVYRTVLEYVAKTQENGFFIRRRQEQDKYWLHETLKDLILSDYFGNEAHQQAITQLEQEVVSGAMSSFAAADLLYKQFKEDSHDNH